LILRTQIYGESLKILKNLLLAQVYRACQRFLAHPVVFPNLVYADIFENNLPIKLFNNKFCKVAIALLIFPTFL